VIYRPDRIGTFEFAVVAALRAEQLRRGCVPRVEAHHKFVVTAQLEVIAGKIARVAEGPLQDVSDTVVLAPTDATLSDETLRNTDMPRAEAPPSVGLAEAKMALTWPVTRGEGS